MRYWAFDPGKMTGVAYWDDGAFWSGQFTVPELYGHVDEWADDGWIEHMQIEKFTITTATIRKAREPDPMDVIGYLKYIAWKYEIEVGWTKPADVMKSFPDPVLKKAGMFTVGAPHGNDASRHLAWKLVTAKVRAASDFLL